MSRSRAVVAMADGTDISQAVVGIVEALAASEWTVVVVGSAPMRDVGWMRNLRQRGVAVLDRGATPIEDIVAVASVQVAVLADWQTAERDMARLRRASPGTRTIVFADPPQLVHTARGHIEATSQVPGVLDQERASMLLRELNVYAGADGVLTGTQADADALNYWLGGSANAHAIGTFTPVSSSALPLADRSGTVYAIPTEGSDHAPLEYLVREIGPRLDALASGHPLYVVGVDATSREEWSGPGVRLVADVPSLAPYVERARVWLLPLGGRATHGQLMTPLLAGTPIVATPAAVEGSPFRTGVDVLVGADSDEFAQAACGLLTDDAHWKRWSRQGRRRALSVVRRDDTRSRLLVAIDTVMAARRPKAVAARLSSTAAPPRPGRTSDDDAPMLSESEPQHSAPAPQSTPAREPIGWHAGTYTALLATARGEAGGEYVPHDEAAAPAEPPVKLLAFYLPQFHPTPENDVWWGRGFTEWTNVSKAVPQFEGHYQPHLPGELGFYDLRVVDVQRRQVDLARQYGIHGFCFYYYWFAGRRLLERPLDQFMSDPAIDFPFCVCWANENWTRRWDGQDSEVLIGQEHTEATDIAFIRDLAPMLRHRNYIRVGDRPVILVYRPMLLPRPAETAQRWREYAAAIGLGDVYLVAAEVFEHVDPRPIGFDAAVEFPPNTPGERRDLTARVSLLNPDYSGTVYEYADLRRLTMKRPRPAYPLFRTVCPSWDNEPRRPGRGATYAFSSPHQYQEWLEEACRATYNEEGDPERRLVFVNAWNEWGEGAHLEPDRRFGYAYLAATRHVIQGLVAEGATRNGAAIDDAPTAPDVTTHQTVLMSAAPVTATNAGGVVVGSVGRDEWTVLFVSHDAARGGAQSVLLDTIAWFRRHTRIRVKVVCLRGGEWLSRFEGMAETLVLSEDDAQTLSPESDIAQRLAAFCPRPDLIYANSVASGAVFGALQLLDAPILTHVHELEMSIQRYAANWMDDVLAHSHHFIACSEPVAENLTLRHELPRDRVSVVPASIALASTNPLSGDERVALRRRLGLPEHAPIVFGCGIGMAYRKGADLFVEVARRVRASRSDARFYWIGELDEEPGDFGRPRITGSADPATFLGLKDDPRSYLQVGDVFLLPSREDPFPLVALEAAGCRLPIVCFDGAGGIPSFVGDDAGRVVPFEDTAAMASAVTELLIDDALRHDLGRRARARLEQCYTTDVTTPRTLAVSRDVAGKLPAVSVIVPNYNHARYLPDRLESVFGQTYQDFEVILLDDASTDHSLSVLEQYRDRADVRIVRNDRNSGSTFRQWLKGIDLARGELIWLAESDDVNHPDFLATLVPLFDDPGVKLAYCASEVIDENGSVVGDYLSTPYLASLSATKWRTDYRVTAEQEINDGLGVKNTILSASAVLFRRLQLSPDMRAMLQRLTLTGDWYFAIQAIAGGDVHYVAQVLGQHRRHAESVIGKLLRQNRVADFFREFHAVQQVIFDLFRLREGFEAKWETYLREQWAAFYPDRPFGDMMQYYPLDQACRQIRAWDDGSTSAVERAVTKR